MGGGLAFFAALRWVYSKRDFGWGSGSESARSSGSGGPGDSGPASPSGRGLGAWDGLAFEEALDVINQGVVTLDVDVTVGCFGSPGQR
jgi:hypothetical protein